MFAIKIYFIVQSNAKNLKNNKKISCFISVNDNSMLINSKCMLVNTNSTNIMLIKPLEQTKFLFYF